MTCIKVQRNCLRHELGDHHRQRPARFLTQRFFNVLLSFPPVASLRKDFLDFLVSSLLNHSTRPRIERPTTGPRQNLLAANLLDLPNVPDRLEKSFSFLGLLLATGTAAHEYTWAQPTTSRHRVVFEFGLILGLGP